MEFQKRENIGWVDLLRIIACFLVVLSHCCDPFVGQFDNDRTSFLTGAFTGSFVRACVPLFVMMSGVLLFPVRLEMGEFYRKRIGRIVVPLIFWSVMLPLLYYVYLNFMVSSVSPSIAPENFTMGATLTKLYTFIFNFTYDTTPLWYLYGACQTKGYPVVSADLGNIAGTSVCEDGCSFAGIYRKLR